MTWLTTCLARCASYALDNRADRKRVAREIVNALPMEGISAAIYEEARGQWVDAEASREISRRARARILKLLCD